jgi:aspartyl-tRNA(Asn)/glutamyl-tRNA(Gln) amidotransferase subunit C
MSFDVKKIAELACLEVDDATAQKLSREMLEILNYVGKLEQVDTTDIPATAHVVSFTTPLRQDVVGEALDRNEALSNAPQRDDTSFIVPRVV